jgi:rhamnopyranosyl-N-acetylglucosaminyl-diphospho-decaprenol beta-1,3/1,4-galactofuranosyltransferase
VKRFFTYRNRGYLMSQPGMRWLLPLELVRFSWFFLATRKDPGAWLEWLRLVRAGRRERFTRP